MPSMQIESIPVAHYSALLPHVPRGAGITDSMFPLDLEGGILIGVYLTDENARVMRSADGQAFTQIMTAKHDPDVQKWCHIHNCGTAMMWGVDERDEDLDVDIVCSDDTKLGAFLEGFVGGAPHVKRLPSVSYYAPEAFVWGLLCGFLKVYADVIPHTPHEVVSRRLVRNGSDNVPDALLMELDQLFACRLPGWQDNRAFHGEWHHEWNGCLFFVCRGLHIRTVFLPPFVKEKLDFCHMLYEPLPLSE